jgi:hypothetical protein
MPRVPLPRSAPSTWEHPADRAALAALRAIPGFDEVVRKVAAFFGERGVRHLFTANAVRVGPTQFPKLDAMIPRPAPPSIGRSGPSSTSRRRRW